MTVSSNRREINQQVIAAKNALKMHDSQTKALVEDITLRAAILRKIDPALINEARLKTGIRVIDAVINLFYVLNTRVHKKRIQEHLTPYQLALSELPQDKKTRLQLIHNLYIKTIEQTKSLHREVPLIMRDNQIIPWLNKRFGLEIYRFTDNILTAEQLNPKFKL